MAHYGVKGMHWGVRKRRGDRPGPSSDAVRVKQHKATVKKGSTDALTTKELQELVTRMNLEQQYARLKPPSKKSAATKLVGDILLNVGKQQATKLVQDQLSKQIEKALEKK